MLKSTDSVKIKIKIFGNWKLEIFGKILLYPWFLIFKCFFLEVQAGLIMLTHVSILIREGL